MVASICISRPPPLTVLHPAYACNYTGELYVDISICRGSLLSPQVHKPTHFGPEALSPSKLAAP